MKPSKTKSGGFLGFILATDRIPIVLDMIKNV